MNVLVPFADKVAAPDDWRDAENYRWLVTLPRTGWAWEFLRRSPEYQAAHTASLTAERQAKHREALPFGLLCFEEPSRDARVADAMWQMKVCRDVLPLASSPMRPGTAVHTLRLDTLRCRTVEYDYGVENRKEVLLAEDGRSLQLTIFGNTPLHEALLLTPALPVARHGDSRLLAVRRLADVVKHGWLRPALYKRERQSARLARVVQALDGWLAKASQREIAIALYTQDRVDRDWNDPRNHMRDHVRRAVAYGRELMTGRYRRFLG
jgi:hypothetical protein